MPLFVADGDRLVPTELARGPWDATALHGGPVAALATRAAERHLPAELKLARLTVELMRPVPLEPLTVQATTLRPGRKVSLVDVTIATAAHEVARARVLAVRAAELALPARVTELAAPPGPESASAASVPPGAGEWVAFHSAGVEMRFVEGRWRDPGPATVWIRLRVPVVDDEEPTAAMRAAAAADFGNGISSEFAFGSWLFINPDLSIHLARHPVGEWVCLDARTILGDAGSGVAESVLSDQRGVFGRSVQSLLIDRLDGPPA